MKSKNLRLPLIGTLMIAMSLAFATTKEYPVYKDNGDGTTTLNVAANRQVVARIHELQEDNKRLKKENWAVRKELKILQEGKCVKYGQ